MLPKFNWTPIVVQHSHRYFNNGFQSILMVIGQSRSLFLRCAVFGLSQHVLIFLTLSLHNVCVKLKFRFRYRFYKLIGLSLNSGMMQNGFTYMLCVAEVKYKAYHNDGHV